MKAGRELDGRLCQLLEPMGKPPIRDKAALAWGILAASPLGFWKFILGSDHRQPIPVSTDLGVTGKAIDELERLEYGVTLYTPNSFTDEGLGPRTTHAVIVWHNPTPDSFEGPDGSYCEGDTLSHAFTLAACKALEMKNEVMRETTTND